MRGRLPLLPSLRRPLALAGILVIALTFFAGTYTQCACDLNPGSCSPGGGGGGGSGSLQPCDGAAGYDGCISGLPGPVPTPAPLLRSWVSTASVVGTFFNWCGPPPQNPCLPPDHHDVAGEHAVDIDASAGTAVYYYDPRPGEYDSNIREADLAWTASCSDGTGGAAAMINLYGIDSTSVTGSRYLAYAVYRHLVQGTSQPTVDNATLLGTIAANASTNPNCWTGPHVHQGVGGISSSVTFEHDTAGYAYPNCMPWTGAAYPGVGWSVGYPFCYQIRWIG